MKSLLAIPLLAISINASADTANGAMIGIGNAMQTWAAQDAEREREERQQQYEIARERRIQNELAEQRRIQEEYAHEDAVRQKAQKDADYKAYIMKQAQILNMHHPDWQAVIKSKEYQEWGVMLPFDTKKALSESMDGEFISSAITAFKEQQLKNKKHQPKRDHI